MKRLIAIQQGMRVEKSKKGYGYNYRDAEQILATAKPLLSEQHCAIICRAEHIIVNNTIYKRVYAGLYAEDGTLIAETFDEVRCPNEMKGMVEQQISGSDTTYCKRYALQNLLAIDDGSMDVDAVLTEQRTNENKQQQKPSSGGQVIYAKQADKTRSKAKEIKHNASDEQLLATDKANRLSAAVTQMNFAITMEEATELWRQYRDFQNEPEFIEAKDYAKQRISVR